MKRNTTYRQSLMDSMVVAGAFVAIIYWTLDSILSIFFSNQFNLFAQLFGPDLYDVYTRVIVLCLLLLFGSHAQSTINRLRLTQEALRASEHEYREFVENLSLGTLQAATEADGRIVHANPATARMLGYSSVEELTEVPVSQLYLSPKDWESFVEQMAQRRRVAAYELLLKTKDGTPLWVSCSGSAKFDDRGKAQHINAVIEDITERKQAEQALRRYELLSSHSRGIIFFIRREDGRILEANNAAGTAYGYSREELLQLTIHDLRASETQEMIFDQMAKADTRGILFETVHRRSDGNTFPVEVSSQGATIAGMRTLVSVVRDISERKRAEQALRESQADLNRAQAVAHIGSWRLDARSNELRWSDESHRIFGIPQETVMTYETFLASVHPEDRQYVDQRWRAALRGEPYDIEHRIIVGDTVKWAHQRGELAFENGGALLGAFGTT